MGEWIGSASTRPRVSRTATRSVPETGTARAWMRSRACSTRSEDGSKSSMQEGSGMETGAATGLGIGYGLTGSGSGSVRR